MPGRIAETAKMVAELDLKTGKFTKGVSTAVKDVGRLSGAVAKSRAVAVGVGVGLERLAEKGISTLGNAIGDGIQGALVLERTMNATQAVIESTGGAAGVTAQQVNDMANSIENLTGVDDKTVQQGENLLLTFTNIGKETFPAAAKAAVDMAVAFNKGDAATADIDAAAIQLGKALNDPAVGFTALKKAGVSFSEAQIAILKNTNSLDKAQTKNYNTLLKTDKAGAERYKAGILANKQLESQKLILAELEKEFGKAGAAANQGFAGDINRANDAIQDAEIAIAQGLIPAVGEVARELSTTLRDPQVMRALKDLGTGLGDVIKGGVAFAKTVPWGVIASSLRTAAGFAKDLLNAFLGLPTWVQTAVITGWGLNKLTGGFLTDIVGTLASGLIKGVLGITAGVVHINAASVVGAGGVPVPTGAAAGEGAAAGGLLATLGNLVLPVTIAAIAAKAATDLSNAALAERGVKGTLATPGSSGDNPLFAVLPFGIGASLQNIATGLGILIGNDKPTPNPEDLGGKIDSLEQRFHTDIVPIGGKIDNLSQRFPGDVAAAISSTSAARDKEISDAIRTVATGRAADDASFAATIAANVVAHTPQFIPTVKLDASQITDLRNVTGGSTAAAQRDDETSKSIQSLISQTELVARSTDIDQLGTVTDRGLSAVDVSTVRGASQTSSAATQAGFHSAQQTFATGLGIEGAIRANRPIINVDVQISATDITQVNVVEDRGGSRSGSRDGDGGGGPGQ